MWQGTLRFFEGKKGGGVRYEILVQTGHSAAAVVGSGWEGGELDARRRLGGMGGGKEVW